MPMLHRHTAESIHHEAAELAPHIDALHAARDPQRATRYEARVRAELYADIQYELRVLSSAMRAEVPALFDEYVRWLSGMRTARNVSDHDLRQQLACLYDVLSTTYPASADVLSEYIGSARDEIGRAHHEPGGASPLGAAGQQYLKLILTGERARAVAFVNDLLDQGSSIEDVYLEVIEAVQIEVGRLWQANQLNVAQEHYATGVGQLVIAQLYPRIMRASRSGPRLMATCVGGELHEMGARMVADFFEMDGWDTTYLGANTPTSSLLELMRRTTPDVLALSATNSFQVSTVASIIEAVRADPALRDLKILVGGRPFRISGELGRRVGADAYALDARAAVRAGRALLGSHPQGYAEPNDKPMPH